MEEKTFLVKYIKSESKLFREGGIYEVVDRRTSYMVVFNNGKGFYINKENAVRMDLPEELFKWESEE